ncbi:mitogen-activated protein kinase kinase kinase 19-like [Hydractinia symbiolongicarpus]|uniref:mitogen-activated protein kinase kinase kinase 19-like n=1 Tax=Hydractinia symbiolongicarpus TaxID=13093 RepID=UPI00254E58D1|nr:mitogen-activated protein kinase kinase kinase 19-like [Hydractinia symbiolongicarpus]XP_057297828.1 mitogen-activated protein kinase kinase kinase 19-like [Hydractinia symbiolongicarpus]XP_057297829.1 mitogen-activated protein kinase kinase kinase 19-like [Hydractinia symbiolongicarpus]
MTKNINVVTTTKGSAFFVDLDSVIQEEITKEKKISIERQSSGTVLFIPLFDDKPKTKKKTSGISEEPDILNRTFTKEDFSKVKTPLNVSLKEKEKNSDVNFLNRINHHLKHDKKKNNNSDNKLLTAVLPSTQLSIKETDIPCHLHPSCNDNKTLSIESEQLNYFQDTKDSHLFSKNNTLPKLPKWATDCTSLDSTIIGPYENPECHVKIEEMFSNNEKRKSSYSSSVLPPISRVSSAKAMKSSSGINMKKAGSVKTKNTCKKKLKENQLNNKSTKCKKKPKTKTCKQKISVSTEHPEQSVNHKFQQIEELKVDASENAIAVKSNNFLMQDVVCLGETNNSDFIDRFEKNEKPENKLNIENVVNVLARGETDAPNMLIESMEKTLSIECVVEELPSHSPNKKLFQYNNFLSRISEEKSQNGSMSFSSKMHRSIKKEEVTSMSNNSTFQEMSKLMFAPGIVNNESTFRSDSPCDSNYSVSTITDRPYVRSVLGNISSRSLYSSSSSYTDNNENEVIEWQKGKMIDRGAFGVVYQGLTDNAQLIAVKEVEIGNSKNMARNYKKLQDEINILKGLRHRNIIRFIGTALEDNVIYIFMEYIAGGSLSNLISSFGSLKEVVFQKFTYQILSGVHYLHIKGVIHRDIKGANILITVKGTIKLIDFGCAKELSLSLGSTVLLKSVKGTPYWMAPEVIQGTGCNHKSDIWSVGCTVMEMATGKPPWSEYPPYAAMYAIAENTNHPPELDANHSAEARSFVAACLVRDMNIRPSAEEMLKHPFVKNT